MMSLWDALRMNMMISYQELVRTFLSSQLPLPLLRDIFNRGYLIKLTCLQISSATISLR
ncbi:Uncharacterised protein [Klebsiella pneumoniae]|nr:Uncharacterised protein [Klebsiella pneumoniae]